MATCWICEKVTTSDEILNVCSIDCEHWLLKNQDLIDIHRSEMEKSFSPAVKDCFLKKSEPEQNYIVMRSFELKNK